MIREGMKGALMVALAVVAALVAPRAALAEPAPGGAQRLAGALETVGGRPLTAQAEQGTRERFLEVVGDQPTKSHSGIERRGENNNKYTRWYGLNDAWCGMFVDWCAREAGVSEDVIPHGIALVRTLKDHFVGGPNWHDWTYHPQAGDLVIYSQTDDAGHVGIVTGADGSRFYTREGNRGDDWVVDDSWAYGTHSTGYGSNMANIVGFISPDYPEPVAADPYPIPDYDFGPNVSLPQGDGIYTIASTLDKSLFVEVEGGGTQNGARVQLWRGTDTDFRRWRFSRNGDGTYTITAVHSGKALDVRGGSREAGAKVQQFEGHGGNNQRWWLQDCGDGSYALKSANSRGFLDVTGGWDNLGPGVEMEQWSGHGREEVRCSEKFIISPSYGRSTTLPQGDHTYSIASLADPSRFVGVSGGSSDNNVALAMSNGEDQDYKRWDFRLNSDGTYTIAAKHSGRVFDVYNDEVGDGAKVLHFNVKESGNDNQHWWLEDMGNGIYMFKAKHSGKFLDVKDGSELVQWRGHGADNQKFIVSPSYGPSVTLPGGDGVYVVCPADDDSLVMEVEGASTSDEANVRIARRTGAANQRFVFKREADGSYTMAAVHSGMRLDVRDAEVGDGFKNGANVQQYRVKDVNNQRWWIEDLGDGTYAMKSKQSGKFLDVEGGSVRDGANLHQWQGTGAANQRFRIIAWANDLSKAEVSPVGQQPWLGVAVEPHPEVKLDGVVLKEGTDYVLSWSDNDWPGLAKLTVTGMGDYVGSKSVEFTVQGYDHDGWVDLGGGAKGYARGGRLVTGWMDLGASKYWFDARGRMATGWTDVDVSGKAMHYYFNPTSGNLARGTWMTIDGRKYYFRESGNVAHGWATIPDNGVDKKYYFDDSHQMVTDWQDIDGSRYFFTANGSMATGTKTIDGVAYLFRSSGTLGKNWVGINGKQYFAREDGTMVMDELVEYEGGTYYLRPSGVMATGWATIGGEKYWFRSSGNMATGWADVDDAYKRYFDKSGHMLTGWQDIGGRRYYFRASGAMQTGEAAIDGKRYVFSDKGVLTAGPLTLAAQEDAEEGDIEVVEDASVAVDSDAYADEEVIVLV